MLEAKARWVEGYLFEGQDSSGREMQMDASVEAGGKGAGFRPAELPMMALAGCTGMDTMEILQKMRQDITGLEVAVSADKKDGYPAGYDGISVRYVIRGRGLDREKVERAVKLSEEKYCTVGRALSAATTITHEIEIIED